MRHTWVGMAVAVCLTVVGAFATEASAAEREPRQIVLQLRWEPQFQFAGYHAALWQGYYAEAGLDVEIRSAVRQDRSVVQATTEVEAGRADFGIGSGDILIANDRGNALTVVASIFQRSPVAIFSQAKSGLRSPADLVGKKVLRVPGDLTDVELGSMLRAEGINNDMVPPANADWRGQALEMLRDGKIDAYAGFTLSAFLQAQQLGIELSAMFPATYGVDFYGDSIFTRRNFAIAQPELVERFVKASLRGWKYALEHPNEIAERVAQLDRVFTVSNPHAFNVSQADEVRRLTLYPVVELGHINPERWAVMHKSIKAAGLIAGDLDLASFIFDPQFRARILRQPTNWIGLGIIAVLVVALLFFSFWSKALREQVAKRTANLMASEEALRASEERYALALAGANDGIWDWDIEKNLVYRSPRWYALLDRDPVDDASVHGSLDHLAHPEDIRLFRKSIRSHLDHGSPFSMEIRLRRSDGSYGWYLSRGEAVRDDQGEPTRMVGSLTDINQRKLAELERDREREFATSLLSAAPLIVLVLSPDGAIQLVNPYFENLTGYTSEEIKGKDWITTFLPERDRAEIKTLFERAVSTEATTRNRNPIVLRDGSERLIEWYDQRLTDQNGATTALLAVGIDVTAQHRNERAVKASSKRLRGILDSFPGFIGVLDADGKIVDANAVYRERVERRGEEFVGKHFSEMDWWAHSADTQRRIREALDSVGRGTAVRDDFPIIAVDGAPMIIDLTFSPLYNVEGAIAETVVYGVDVTVRKRIEQQLRVTLSEKDTLLREIHHRVKNNLQVISSLLYFQTKKVKDPADLTVMNESRERLRSMILVHEKLYGSDDLTRIDFGSYVRSLAGQIARSYSELQNPNTLSVQSNKYELPIEIALPCGMIVTELLINAYKYAFPDNTRGAIEVKCTESRERLSITVADNGVGLPAGFSETNATSFGWSLINNLARQVNGTIEISRARGTAVTLEVPVRLELSS